MSTRLPSSITIEERSGTTCYVLPHRPLGILRYLLIGLTLLALGATVFIVTPLAGTSSPGSSKVFQVSILLLGVLSIALTVLICAWLAFGCSIIELTGLEIASVEKLGPLRWRRSRMLDDLHSIKVADARDQAGKAGDSGSFNMAVICIAFEHQKKLFPAPGYPASMLRPLAEDLAARIEHADLQQVESKRSIPLTYVDETGRFHPDHPPVQPPKSKVTIERREGSVEFRIPPMGVMKSGLTVSGIAVCVLTLFPLAFLIASLTHAARNTSLEAALFALLIVGSLVIAFGGLGTGLLVVGIRRGRAAATIIVREHETQITTEGFWNLNRYSLSNEEIRSIGVIRPKGTQGFSNVHLRVNLTHGRSPKLFVERPEEELEWLAHEIGMAIGCTVEPLRVV